MGRLVEWTRTHTSRLFPISAQYSGEGGSQVRVSWLALSSAHDGQRTCAAALQFDQDVIDALYLASPGELDRIGCRLADLVQRWLRMEDLARMGGEPVVIPVGERLLEH